MAAAMKMIVLILTLGMDTLLISMSLGFVKTKGKLKIALVFACAEALMPLIGLLIGNSSGQLMGHWSSIVGGILLLAVAVWLIFFEDEEEEEEKLERNLVGWTLLVTALSISLDELAVGFSIGLIGVPIALTIVLIAVQAFVFTSIGLAFGAKLKPLLGEWSEKLAGTVLGLLGLWILGEAVLGMISGG
ncbi:manganese efflux pump [Paenibacillus filicis]|uniref:Manganese efflux pump n=1 Tax=Paenibacillus gyeongsangnamensis TaxID=3388067 RepID=A0ABT4QIT2_9BACL|nr:manganese efflux pump [Paenibacillus filicis]MCZ8516595.1 manganese efflux pump [Paenibacillus filicis]